MGIIDPPALPRATTQNPGEFYGIDSTGKPTGLSHSLAYAEDTTGFALPLTVNVANYPLGCVISVPVTKRFVELRAFMPFQVTAAGNGSLIAGIYEITSGTPVFVDGDGPAGSFLIGTWSAFQSARVSIRLGPQTTERQFAVGGLMVRDAASALAASIRSQSGGNPRTWIEAVAL